MYAAGVQRHAEQLRAVARAEWSLCHEHMVRLHRNLAQEHEEQAAKLLEKLDLMPRRNKRKRPPRERQGVGVPLRGLEQSKPPITRRFPPPPRKDGRRHWS
jgi:hypothetical protein